MDFTQLIIITLIICVPLIIIALLSFYFLKKAQQTKKLVIHNPKLNINKNIQPHNDIYYYIDDKNHIANINKYISNLIIEFFAEEKNIYFCDDCFIREIIYFSQLYVINSFKDIPYTSLNETEFLSATRYLVATNLSYYQNWLLCNKQEKENIQTLIKNNEFTESDINLLCKILFVAACRGYASIPEMLTEFDDLDKKDYDSFKKNIEAYIGMLTRQISILCNHELERSNNQIEKNRKALEYAHKSGITSLCLRETYTFYIM